MVETPLAQYLNHSPFEPGEETDALKRKFAEALLRSEDDPYKAARSIERVMTRASYMAMHWPDDETVIEHMGKIAAERGASALIPSKEEFAATLLEQAGKVRTADVRLDYYKLFANVMGYVEKPAAPTINNNVAVVNKVMRVPRSVNREEARKNIAAQQARLINASAA